MPEQFVIGNDDNKSALLIYRYRYVRMYLLLYIQDQCNQLLARLNQGVILVNLISDDSPKVL